MGSVNKVMLLGNLGDDPELRYTRNENAVCNFRMATSRKYDGEETTQWHRIVVWGKSAEACAEYLTKGSQVCVEGRIEYRSFEGDDGDTVYMTEVIAEQVTFCGSPSGGGRDRGRDRDRGSSSRDEDRGRSRGRRRDSDRGRRGGGGGGGRRGRRDSGGDDFGGPPPSDDVPF